MTSNLAEKRIVLGVTGSIAAFKAATIASTLTKMGALVDVIMTEAAQKFLTPLTFAALTGRPVYTDMWNTESGGGMSTHIAHVGLAHQADLLVAAPTTAHSIAKMALGISDDLLSITAMALSGRRPAPPIVIAPAMDAGMYSNEATQHHVTELQARGVMLAGPTMGRMASGMQGVGRMVEPDEVIGVCRMALGLFSGRLRGRQLVVTAGPTREPLDPVRFISNRSSGRQGYAIAQAALDEGAEVTLISGPVDLPAPVGANRIEVTTAVEMRDAVLEYAACDALIMAAAVSDFRPVQQAHQKIKKAEGAPHLELTPNPDILREISARTRQPVLMVGFAAESQDLLKNAQQKLETKNLDLIVANDITAEDAGFATLTNRVHLVTEEGSIELPLLQKDEVAARIIAWVAHRLEGGG